MADEKDIGKAQEQQPEAHEAETAQKPVVLTDDQLDPVAGGRLPDDFRKPTSPF